MRRVRPIPILLLAACVLAFSRGSGPRFWTTATASDFLAGRSEGVFVNLQGVVTAGPSLTSRLSTESPPQVWSLARQADGTLWAGTGGGEGHVIRMRSGQPDDVVFEAEESNVFAVTVAGDRVFAATSPDGRVVAIEPDGTSSTFFDPEETYIWALIPAPGGGLYVGAGTPAVIYQVDADGNGEVLYHPPADHVVALALDGEQRLLAGTESPGRLYRFDDGRPFVVLDSGVTELRALTVAPDGSLFAAAVDRGSTSPSDGEATSVAVVTSTAEASQAGGGSGSSSSSTPSRRSSIFHIATSGQWEQIWQTPDLVYDVMAMPDGSVLAATGPGGRLYRVTADRQVLLHTGVDARQVTRFAGLDGDGRLTAFATANPGRVLEVGAGVESPASYLSDVHDTDSVATWGLMRWEAQGNVSLFTRSGNTAEPDDSWSAWSDPLTAPAGSSIASPAARFLQWKAELSQATGTAAALTSVTVAYLPRNARPQVGSITVHPPGVVFQRPFASDDSAIAGLDDQVADARRPPGDPGPTTPSPGRRMFQKGLQTIAWTASDADDDDRLSYTLQYRRDGDATWHDLRADLRDRIFVWDTTAMADGRYVIRIVASDSPTNPDDRALSGDRDSDPVVIDNTPPDVTTQVTGQGTDTRVVIQVADARSPILKVEYSLRGGPWAVIYPSDGLADSPNETYEIAVASADEAGGIVVRATDLLQNVTSRAVGGTHDR